MLYIDGSRTYPNMQRLDESNPNITYLNDSRHHVSEMSHAIMLHANANNQNNNNNDNHHDAEYYQRKELILREILLYIDKSQIEHEINIKKKRY
jgi:hypothetical protein